MFIISFNNLNIIINVNLNIYITIAATRPKNFQLQKKSRIIYDCMHITYDEIVNYMY